MTAALERRGSAKFEVVEAGEIGRYNGVLMAVRALRDKAEDERKQGRIGGAYTVAADYLLRSLQATVEATPP